MMYCEMLNEKVVRKISEETTTKGKGYRGNTIWKSEQVIENCGALKVEWIGAKFHFGI